MFEAITRILLAKVESVIGTDSEPVVGSDAIEASNIKVNYTGDKLANDRVRTDISAESPGIGKRYAEISFTCKIKGSGTAGTAPRIGRLLQACAFSEAADVGSSVIYNPTSSSKKTVTVYVYNLNLNTGSAVLEKFTGCVGNVQFKFPAGQNATMEVSLRGLCAAVNTDVVAPGTPVFNTTVAPVVENATFTLNSVTSLVVQELSLNMDNSISEHDDISAAAGLKSFEVSGREPKGSFNPEVVSVATYDFKADWAAATTRALSMVLGSAAGNKLTITAPKVTIDNIADGEREKYLTKDIPFSLGRNTGNDEISLKFE